MNGETITAIFSLFGSLIGTFGGIIAGAKLMNYRIEQLEKQVEKHNNVVDQGLRSPRCQTRRADCPVSHQRRSAPQRD